METTYCAPGHRHGKCAYINIDNSFHWTELWVELFTRDVNLPSEANQGQGLFGHYSSLDTENGVPRMLLSNPYLGTLHLYVWEGSHCLPYPVRSTLYLG
jgi:hypothetical protein